MTPPVHLNNDSVTNQLLKYRAEQHQKFIVEQRRRQQEAGYSSSKEPGAAVEAQPGSHPALLKLQLDASANGTDSRSGTAEDFGELQHELVHSEQMRRHQGEVPVESSRSCSSSEEPHSARSATSTPRLRGSSSLRAISAARALREAGSTPLPGAAWPGHGVSGMSSTEEARHRSRMELLSGGVRRSTGSVASGRRPPCLPPKLPLSRSLSSCALEVSSSSSGSFGLGQLCC